MTSMWPKCCDVKSFWRINVYISSVHYYLVLTRFFNLTLTQEKASPYFWILCNIFFFRWCCLTLADQVSMTPAPMISPIQFWEKNLYLSSWWSAPQKDLRQDEFLPFEVEHIWAEPRQHYASGSDFTMIIMFLLTCLSFPLVSAPLNSDIYNQFELRL